MGRPPLEPPVFPQRKDICTSPLQHIQYSNAMVCPPVLGDNPHFLATIIAPPSSVSKLFMLKFRVSDKGGIMGINKD